MSSTKLGIKELEALAETLRASGYFTVTRTKWTKAQARRRILDFWRRTGRFPRQRDFDTTNELPTSVQLWNLYATRPSDRRGRGGRWNGWRMEKPRLDHQEWDSRAETILTRVQRDLVDSNLLRAREVLNLPNVTIRRHGIDKYGMEKLARLGEKLAEDEFGILWKLPGEWTTGEHTHMVYLEVENKTPEQDGTFAHYFLRVPPTMTVPRQAAAWTFNVTDGWEEFEFGAES